MAFKSCTSTPDLFDSFLATPPRNEVLKELGRLVDWEAMRGVVAPAYKVGSGGAVGYDPVLLIKLLLLERLYQLSDVQVVEEAADRLSFREFLGLKASDPVPDDTTMVKFRNRLRPHGLVQKITEAIEAQLAAQGLTVKAGSIKMIDATLIQAATRPPTKPRKEGAPAREPLDPDADFTVRRGKIHYGYKAHLAQDRATGILTGCLVTPASVHDSRVFEQFLDGGEAEVLADKAYDSRANRAICAALGVKASIMKRAPRGQPIGAWWKGRNKSISRVRSFVEGAPAQLKRYLGCGRAIYRGLTKTSEQLAWGVLAFNLRRAAALARGPDVAARPHAV